MCREPSRVVASLISLTKTFGGLFGQLTAWEELVSEFVRSDDISSEVTHQLWNVNVCNLPVQSSNNNTAFLAVCNLFWT